MPIAVKLGINVEHLDEVLKVFDRIKVYRSTTGYVGPYTEITTSGTRLHLEYPKTSYEYVDLLGGSTYWYRTSYYSTTSLMESGPSDPELGDDPSTAGIMTVDQVKALYLFGVKLGDDAGNQFSDFMFEWGIRQAIARVEKELDIKIRPTVITDQRYDYYRNDYQQWMALTLRECPVISVEAVRLKWQGNNTVVEFPTDWIQLQPDYGQVNIIPSGGSISSAMITAGGNFLPLLAAGQDFVPNLISVDYTAGFAAGMVPDDIRDLVGKLASYGPLNIAGDLIGGAGIASSSISMDGLSQSINTTSSATNAGYGSRLIQYSREIKEVLPLLRKHYRGLRLTALG